MNVGLMRVSSLGQKDNNSLFNQRKMIEDYCSIYDIKLDEMIEEVYTGTTMDRDGLNRIKSLVIEGKVESNSDIKILELFNRFEHFS